MRRLMIVLSLLLLAATAGSPAEAHAEGNAVRLSCGIVITDLSGPIVPQRTGAMEKPVDLMPYITRLRAGRPRDGEHRIFRTESGMTVSVRLREGRIAGYVVDREATIEYHDMNDTDDFPYEEKPEGFHQGDCGPGEAPCWIEIEDETGRHIYIGCCEIIILD